MSMNQVQEWEDLATSMNILLRELLHKDESLFYLLVRACIQSVVIFPEQAALLNHYIPETARKDGTLGVEKRNYILSNLVHDEPDDEQIDRVSQGMKINSILREEIPSMASLDEDERKKRVADLLIMPIRFL